MTMIYVKPAEGGRVRQPERQNRVMPVAGAYVPRDAHYERLLLSGDVLEAPDPQKPEPEAPAEKLETPQPQTSARGRRASGASEE